jgi:hypothetical protein
MWVHYVAQILCYRHDLPHLKEHEVIISCSSLACALALQTLDAAKYLLDQPEFMPPRVSLLRPICDKEDRQESMSSNVEESAVKRPRTDAFFEGRETMATWSCERGWQADEEVVKKCREEEAEWLSSRLQKGEISSWSDCRNAHTNVRLDSTEPSEDDNDSWYQGRYPWATTDSF